MLDEAASAIGGGVTTTAVGAAGGGRDAVSSFLLQAAKDTAATSETNNSAFSYFLLNLQGSDNYRSIAGNPSIEDPIVFKAHGKRDALPAPSPRL